MQQKKNAIRFWAMLLTVAIIITTVGVGTTFMGGAASFSYWDGSTLTAPADLGNGNYGHNCRIEIFVIENA